MSAYPYAVQDWNRYQRITVQPLAAALGARVQCGDLRDADDATFAEIRRAWLDHLVLVFTGQQLSDEDLLGLGRRFGALDDSERPQPKDQPNGQDRNRKALTIVSNVVENGTPIGALGDGDLVWHTDMSYIAVPPDASLLYALEVPSSGGETGFCNMYAALETLPEELGKRLHGMMVKHDSTHNSSGTLRKGFDRPTDVSRSPGALHPAVRTHPETGLDALYLGRRPHAYIQGLPVSESEVLLDRLWAHASDPRFGCYHRWSPGDLVIWDNRCTMHRRNAFPASERRVMHRTQIKGTTPFLDTQIARSAAHPRARVPSAP